MLCIKIQLFLSKTEGLGMASRGVYGITTSSGMASAFRLYFFDFGLDSIRHFVSIPYRYESRFPFNAAH